MRLTVPAPSKKSRHSMRSTTHDGHGLGFFLRQFVRSCSPSSPATRQWRCRPFTPWSAPPTTAGMPEAQGPASQAIEAARWRVWRAVRPITAQPVMAQPVMAQPVMAQPVMAQPVMAQPVMAQPVTAQGTHAGIGRVDSGYPPRPARSLGRHGAALPARRQAAEMPRWLLATRPPSAHSEQSAVMLRSGNRLERILREGRRGS